MDIACMQAFIAIADLGSFSAASEKLFLTQPAISKRIASLENELAARLFDRINRQVSLTEAGLALLPRVRQILLDIEDSKRAVNNLSSQVIGTLSLATSHHIGLHRLPPILRRFSVEYIKVELDIQFMDSEAACRAVERGELEMAIVTLPLTEIHDICTEVIWSDPMEVIVNNSHPLSKLKPVSVKDLSEHNAILPSTGTYTRQIIENAMQQYKSVLNISLTTNYLETIKMLVSVGLGWSILPKQMLSKDICVLPIKELRMSRQLGIVWHQKRTLSNAASCMQNILRQALTS